MTDELLNELLQAVKDESGVYWADDDKRLTRYIRSSYKWLIVFNDNEDVQFDNTSLEFELITQRARYMYNNALDVFELNYTMLINKLSLTYALQKERVNNATT